MKLSHLKSIMVGILQYQDSGPKALILVSWMKNTIEKNKKKHNNYLHVIIFEGSCNR